MSKPCLTTAVPAMFIGKQVSRSRVDHFMKNKYIPLCNTAGKLDTCFLFFSATSFTDMMKYFFNIHQADGVRVYIADYSAEGHESVPAGYGGMLTLIFSPTRDKDRPSDIGIYYSIPPKGNFDTVRSQLDKLVANEWVVNYQSKKLRVLNGTVANPAAGDTKSVHFTMNQISELLKEIQCQKATGIKAYFGSVDPTNANDLSTYKTRLLLQFILTIQIGADETEFYIEDRDGFSERPRSGEFDTGNPCPPAYCEFSELPLPPLP